MENDRHESAFPFERAPEGSLDFIRFNLDLYGEDDREFKLELAALLRKNMIELNKQLEKSLDERRVDHFRKAYHTVKTTLFILGGEMFTGIAEDIRELMIRDRYRSLEMERMTTRFSGLMKKAIRNLDDVIKLL